MRSQAIKTRFRRCAAPAPTLISSISDGGLAKCEAEPKLSPQCCPELPAHCDPTSPRDLGVQGGPRIITGDADVQPHPRNSYQQSFVSLLAGRPSNDGIAGRGGPAEDELAYPDRRGQNAFRRPLVLPRRSFPPNATAGTLETRKRKKAFSGHGRKIRGPPPVWQEADSPREKKNSTQRFDRRMRPRRNWPPCRRPRLEQETSVTPGHQPDPATSRGMRRGLRNNQRANTEDVKHATISGSLRAGPSQSGVECVSNRSKKPTAGEFRMQPSNRISEGGLPSPAVCRGSLSPQRMHHLKKSPARSRCCLIHYCRRAADVLQGLIGKSRQFFRFGRMAAGRDGGPNSQRSAPDLGFGPIPDRPIANGLPESRPLSIAES